MDELHDYDDPAGNVRYYHHRKAALVKLFIHKYANNRATFLDAGAGRGPYSVIASPIYKKVYLYEYDSRELAVALEKTRELNNVTCGQVDLTSIPLNDKEVDIIVCSEVLEHIPYEQRAMNELTRIIKPGARMLFSMPNACSIFYGKVRIKPNHKEILRKLITTHKNIYGTPTEAGLQYSEWEMVRHISFPFWKIEKIAKRAGLRVVSRTGVNVIPIPYRLRKFFIEKMPFGLVCWIKIDSLLGKTLPWLGSFYFIELRKDL
jgi:ubiquinone/menaquinone biosynthesis C-methylase UbiE